MGSREVLLEVLDCAYGCLLVLAGFLLFAGSCFLVAASIKAGDAHPLAWSCLFFAGCLGMVVCWQQWTAPRASRRAVEVARAILLTLPLLPCVAIAMLAVGVLTAQGYLGTGLAASLLVPLPLAWGGTLLAICYVCVLARRLARPPDNEGQQRPAPLLEILAHAFKVDTP